MQKKAHITITLVQEANKVSNTQIIREIKESLHCAWLADIEKIKIHQQHIEKHHRFPDAKIVKTHG
ncbi:MAG: hypothetical protein QW270_08600 [Candidatus Bathyarchaeia archaeon]